MIKTHNITFIDNKVLEDTENTIHKDDNENGFEFYNLYCIIGQMKSGKSQVSANLSNYFLNKQLVTEIFIISQTIKYNKAFSILNIPEHKIFDNMNDSDLALDYIFQYCNYKRDKWEEIKQNYTKEEYNKLYKNTLYLYEYNKYYNEHVEDTFNPLIDELTLNNDDLELLEDNNYNKSEIYYDKGPSILLILDDVISSSVLSSSNQNKLTNLIINHRHLHLNIMLLVQRFTKIPLTLRILFKVYVVFNISSNNEIKNFFDEVACEFFKNFNEFYDVFKKTVRINKHNFMILDKFPINDNKNLKIRINFDKYLTID